MLFTLPLFLFYLLPAFFIVYFLVSEKYKNAVILLFSLCLYAYSSKALISVLVFSVLFNYSAGLLIRGKYKLYVVFCGIIINAAILGIFKYYNFFISNANEVLNQLHIQSIHSSLNIALPVGLSFFTFQNIAYLVDIYREETEPERNIFLFAVFVSMFPKLIMGPIERYGNVKTCLKKKDLSLDNFALGLRRFIIGLAKKVIIADNLDYLINNIFALKNEQVSTLTAWAGVILFSIQLYYDFSGYSDMAVGLGKMCGFTLMENFNYPYISKSIQEFWRRWHISLSTWLSDYIFKPLQFNFRHIKNAGNISAVLITFFISGLWHGASWNFIAWGVFHGIFLSLEFIFLGKLLTKAPRYIAHIYALLVITTGWVFFKTDNMTHAFELLEKMFSFSFSNASYISIANYTNYETVIFIFIGAIFTTPVSRKITNFIAAHKSYAIKNELSGNLNIMYIISMFFLLLISILYIGIHDYKPFLYGVF